MKRSSKQKLKLDIVTSTLNEEDNIGELYYRIKSVMRQEKSYSWRLIICDNFSQDNTWQIVSQLAEADRRVLGIRLTRDFKLDNSLSCGLDHCEGDVAVFMASDLEDPPELISSFLRSYESGNLHVAAQITQREDMPWLRRFLTQIFYRLLFDFSKGMIQKNVSDFRLVDRKVYSAARMLREKYRFMRGIFAWTGYSVTLIPITRKRRQKGVSSFESRRFFSVIDQSREWIYAFSKIPLKIISIFGILVGFLALLGFAVVFVVVLTKGVPFAGFGSLVSIMLLGFACVFIFLGVIGTYLGLISDESKSRPIYIIRDKTF
jgi:glycosyltransferase involved in cell wall biosynthesis